MASSIASELGMVHISTTHLLESERVNKTQIAAYLPTLLKRKLLVPDDVICPLVQNRINQTDCQIHGYFLDGFPVTIKQWNRFCQWHTMPSIVVCFRVDNSELEYNIKHSKIDPENGEVYHDTEIEILPEEVQKRLVETGEDVKNMLRESKVCLFNQIRDKEY